MDYNTVPRSPDSDQTSQSEIANPISSQRLEVGNNMQEGEVIRIELYEEIPTIHRETVIREKVQIKKIAKTEPSDPHL